MTVWNFAAGPAVLPRAVLERAQREMLDWNGCGMSVMEMSHRSAEFEGILAAAKDNLRKLLAIPTNYHILFLQGGATTQFSALPLNLATVVGDSENKRKVDYIVTGTWSQKAVEEAVRMLGPDRVHIAASTKTNGFNTLPENIILSSDEPAYVYYCVNETIHGVEFPAALPPALASLPKSVPIIADMSSDILSRPFNVSDFGVIYAGAQKNIGPAGVTLVIIRDDLLTSRTALPSTPLMLDLRIAAANNSLYNTPPTYGIYIAGLVFEWLLESVGGLEKMAVINAAKSKLLYDCIDNSNGFYVGLVKPHARSNMNITFRIHHQIQGAEGERGPSKTLEALFAKEATAQGLIQLAGHRSAGGLRASLYNAMPEEGVRRLVEFMNAFASAHA